MPDFARHLFISWLVAGLPLILAVIVCLSGKAAQAQESGPTKHFSVGDPAELSDADAEDIYRRLAGALAKGYRLSEDSVTRAYQSWSRFNTAPYRSATHGERFVNNYTNGLGRSYGAFEEAGDLPVGSIVAKDSFAVTAAGDVFSGPLFVMEKMPAGFNAKSRNWKYSMIMPDGSVFGVTNGADSRNVGFCISCHEKAGAENDHLFFLPQAYRPAATLP